MKVHATESALEELKRIMEQKEALDQTLRLYVSGFGWSGPRFGIALDEQTDEDQVDETANVKFIVAKELLDQFGEFRVDFSDNWLRKGFVVEPANFEGGGSC